MYPNLEHLCIVTRMAHRVDPSQVNWHQPSQPPIYPWDQWFDGTVWCLKAGTDWFGNLATFRAHCYRMGREYGYRVRTRLSHDGLYIQALALDGSELGPLDEHGLPISSQSP